MQKLPCTLLLGYNIFSCQFIIISLLAKIKLLAVKFKIIRILIKLIAQKLKLADMCISKHILSNRNILQKNMYNNLYQKILLNILSFSFIIIIIC